MATDIGADAMTQFVPLLISLVSAFTTLLLYELYGEILQVCTGIGTVILYPPEVI